MRIDSYLRSPEVPEKDSRVHGELAGSELSKTSGRGEYESNLSAGSVRIQSLEAKVQSAPEIRKVETEQLAASVRSGNYEVDSDHIADAMMADQIWVKKSAR